MLQAQIRANNKYHQRYDQKQQRCRRNKQARQQLENPGDRHHTALS